MTQRLLVTLGEDHVWSSVDGLLASQNGMSPLDLPLDRLCNLVYWYLTRGVDLSDPKGEQAFRKWEAKLWRPPVGEVPTKGPWSAEAETAAFKAFARQVKPSDSAPDAKGKTPTPTPRQARTARQEATARPRPRTRPRQQPRRSGARLPGSG